MNAIDTNVFIYRLDRRDPVKQGKARSLLRQLAVDTTPTVLLWQVLGELMPQLRYWQDRGQLTRDGFLRYVATFRRLHPLVMPTSQVLDRALDLAGRHVLSHWDSMLVGACQEAGVTRPFTEDTGAPATYDGVELVNPFI